MDLMKSFLPKEKVLRDELLSYMLDRELSVAAVAKELGLAHNTMKNFLYSSRCPSFKTLAKLTRFLGFDVKKTN